MMISTSKLDNVKVIVDEKCHGSKLVAVPDFICIGAQKAGTTWLFDQVRGNPDIFMKTKELNYFISGRDAKWYSHQFNGSAGRLCGDMSPSYARENGIAQRIHNLCPHARIIYLLRDPAARAFSQWKMARRMGNIPMEISFSQAFAADMRYMRTRGEYFKFIREYTLLYPLESKFKVLWYDDIIRRPRDVIRDFQAFIGANPEWISPDYDKIVNKSVDQQSMSEGDYKIVSDYYLDSNRELLRVLNMNRLPWESE